MVRPRVPIGERSCSECGAGLVPGNRWREASPEQRALWASNNLARAGAAYECRRCYRRANPERRSVLPEADLVRLRSLVGLTAEDGDVGVGSVGEETP